MHPYNGDNSNPHLVGYTHRPDIHDKDLEQYKAHFLVIISIELLIYLFGRPYPVGYTAHFVSLK